MASWQQDPTALMGKDIVYLVAMNENCARQPPTPSDIDQWQAELGFSAQMMTDPLRTVYTDYADANGCEPGAPGSAGCSNAVTVVIDRSMRIRHFGSTYLCGTGAGNTCGQAGQFGDVDCLDETLDLLLALDAE